MNKFLRNFFVTALAIMSLNAMGQAVVTFDASVDKGTHDAQNPGADQVSKSGITVAISDGAMNLTDQYRCYKNATLTVTSTEGNIAKVEFTCTAEGEEKYGPGSFTDPTTGSYSFAGKVGTWTGDAESFTLTASKNQGRINNIVVTLSGGVTVEFWDASTLDLTTAIKTRENKNENLKTVPEQYPGEAPDEAQIRADATASVKLTGVSTPNSDGAPEEAWRYPTTDTKQFLNLDACPVKFAGSYLQAKTGNPSMLDIEYFFTNSDGNRVGPRTVEDFWAPGCGKLPAKGEYIEVSFSKAGTFVAGLFIQRPTSNLYIIDKETIQLLAPSAIKIAGFNNNNTVKPAEDADAYQPMKVNDDYTISYANPDYSINTGKQVFGHVSFDVEAGKTYLMLNPKNQLGIYGFQFTPGGDPSGVETIKTNKVWNADAPMYNLSGQKVDKSYKGIVIQNGRKFFNK